MDNHAGLSGGRYSLKILNRIPEKSCVKIVQIIALVFAGVKPQMKY